MDPTSSAFNAFLSYSHSDQLELAAEIQRVLHRIARPWYRLRAVRVFRDKSSITLSESLWKEIEGALQRSEFFILLASPAAAKSPWVAREVEWWLARHGTRNLVLVLGGGTLAWDTARVDFDWSVTTSLPPSVRGKFADEPLWVDVSFFGRVKSKGEKDRLQAELLPVAALLHHKPPDVLGGEDLRRRRTAYLIASSLVVLAISAIAGGLFVWREAALDVARANLKEEGERRRANEQAARASRERGDRISSIAFQSAADDGINPKAVAQLGYVTNNFSAEDVQMPRMALRYWLQYFKSATEAFGLHTLVNWGNKSYLLVDGRTTMIEGGHQAVSAVSRRVPVVYVADAARQKFRVYRRNDGSEIFSVDIADELQVNDGLELYEILGGKFLLLKGRKHAQTLGGESVRLLLMTSNGDKAVWMQPRTDNAYAVLSSCTEFQLIEDDFDTPKRWKRIVARQTGDIVESSRRAGPREEKLSESFGNGRDVDTHCSRLSVPLIVTKLEFPAKKPELTLWSGAAKPQPADTEFGKPLTRALTTEERRSVIKRLKVQADQSDQSVDAEGARIDALKTLMEVESDSVWAIQGTNATLMMTSGHGGGAATGGSVCNLPRVEAPIKCVHYTVWAAVSGFGSENSADGRYVLISDVAYHQHDGFVLLDMLHTRRVNVEEYPFRTAVASDFDLKFDRLAVLSEMGELYVYSLVTTAESTTAVLIMRVTTDALRPSDLRSRYEGDQMPCLRIVGDRLIYCNRAAGLTALTVPTGEILWTTSRIVAKGKDPVLYWPRSSEVAVVFTVDGLRIFAPLSGVMLSDWIDVRRMGAARGFQLRNVAVDSDQSVYLMVGNRWLRRIPPLSDAELNSALTSLSCLTGYEDSVALKPVRQLICSSNR